MVLLIYVDHCLIFSPYKNKIDDAYASHQENFNIEDDWVFKKIGMDLDRQPYGSIHLRQPYLNQRIINMIPGMDKSITKMTHALNPPPEKKWGISSEEKWH